MGLYYSFWELITRGIGSWGQNHETLHKHFTRTYGVDQIKATFPLTAIAVYLASVNKCHDRLAPGVRLRADMPCSHNKNHDRRVLGKGLGSGL
ncbi:MAG: hypothetical protein LBU85_12830 [Treponema sp.]|nr:hypothetical protein [Treponema sp.]